MNLMCAMSHIVNDNLVFMKSCVEVIHFSTSPNNVEISISI